MRTGRAPQGTASQDLDRHDAHAFLGGGLNRLTEVRALKASWRLAALGRIEKVVHELDALKGIAIDDLAVGGGVSARAAEASHTDHPLRSKLFERFRHALRSQHVGNGRAAGHRAWLE